MENKISRITKNPKINSKQYTKQLTEIFIYPPMQFKFEPPPKNEFVFPKLTGWTKEGNKTKENKT